MLKGTLMQNKPSDLYLHYYKYQPELIGMAVRYGLRHEFLPQAIVDELNDRNMDVQAVCREIVRMRENMPSITFH